jgi:preprotein translocase subunit YajC
MIIEALFGLFIIISVVYFIFVRLAEKKEEKFEKRKW